MRSSFRRNETPQEKYVGEQVVAEQPQEHLLDDPVLENLSRPVKTSIAGYP